MNDMDAMTFCESFLTADKGTVELEGVTAQSGLRACDTYAWDTGTGNWSPLWMERVDAGETARRVADEIKRQLDTTVRPVIEGKYKLKHR